MKPSYFDIETGPLTLWDLERFTPEFKAPSNYTDPKKIEAYIEKEKARWAADAALSPFTGRVLCIGIQPTEGEPRILDNPKEADLLYEFWQWLYGEMIAQRRVVGWCIHDFDLNFLEKRSHACAVAVPPILHCGPEDRYYHQSLYDLQKRWKGNDRNSPSNLDAVAKFLGFEGKLGNGADFSELWNSDRQNAIAYLLRDLDQTRKIYERVMGTYFQAEKTEKWNDMPF